LFLTVLLNGLAVWRAWLFIRNRPPSSTPFEPAVSLLIPVCGIEGKGLAHFERFCRLDWMHYEVIFTVLDPQDPAVPLLQQLSNTSTCDVHLQIGGKSEGRNLKIRNLLNGVSRARYEWMVICDADIKPEMNFFKGLFYPFAVESTNPTTGKQKPIGMVHSLYRCSDESTTASSWENVWINCDFWVQGLLGDWVKGTDFAFGAAMAFNRKTLDEIGGLAAIRDYLADDYQLGNRVARSGKRVVFSPHFVDLEGKPQTWDQTWKHLLRWSRTIRVCQPGGHAGSILTNMTFWAVVAACIHPFVFLPWSIFVIALRIAMANQCRNWALGQKGLWTRWWLIPFKDLAQFWLWILAFQNGPVEWRGVRYRLQSDGKLTPAD
jgi:ceramide glucosyltransferase